MKCYKIENLKGIVHYTDQETEIAVFAKKYGCIKITIVDYVPKEAA